MEPIVQDPAMLPLARYAHLSAVSRDKLIVCGGQRHDNSWIYEISAYDLKRHVWVSKTPQPESRGLHSKGAYRSVAISTNQRVVFPVSDSHSFTGTQALPYSEDEPGYGGDIYCYSNYDFAKVRRELEVLRPLDGVDAPPVKSEKFASIPDYTVRDLSGKMSGVSQPPGLRFPAGGIVGHHFVLTGLYLASTSAALSVWALDLRTMVWTHIEPTALKSGSWNRSIICPDSARLLVFGNADSDLTTDYGKRAVNLNHVAVIELEAYGIYRPPTKALSDKKLSLALNIFDQKLLYDFEVVGIDGRSVKCSRRILEHNWPWFAEQQSSIVSRAGEIVHEVASMDIHDVLVESLSPARMTPNRLHLPEQFPVCVALVQYFYTMSLSTPLQTRGQVLTSLLFIANKYKIERLRKLVVHALHSRLDAEHAHNIVEIASLAAEVPLQARALMILHSSRNVSGKPTLGQHSRGPGATRGGGGGGGGGLDGQQTGGPNAQPRLGAPPPSEGSGSQTTSGSSAPTITEGHLPVTNRRARADSLTVPHHLLTQLEPSLMPDHPTEDSIIVSLLGALDLNTPQPSSIRFPAPSSRSTSPSPSFAGSTSTNGKKKRSPPPMMPPPVRPLPIVPQDALLTPPVSPHASMTDGHLRASSPAYSEATSAAYPRTPSECTRDSTYMMMSQDSHDQSFASPSERRLSISGSSLRSKTTTMPSLPEYGVTTFVMSEDDLQTRASTETSEGEHEALQTPCAVAVDPVSAPLDHSFNEQQEQAMRKLTANSGKRNSKLTRATSLTSLGSTGQRPHSAIGTYGPIRDGNTGTIRANGTTMASLAEITDFGPEPTPADRSKTWSQNKHGLSSTEVLNAPYVSKQPRHSMLLKTPQTEAGEMEQLAKFHAFIAEQQRQAGAAGAAEAESIARKATGRAGGRTRFGALRAKMADVLLHT